MNIFNGKYVAYSQRMDYIDSHKEWRDNIDQRIPKMIENLGGIPIGIPNDLVSIANYISTVSPKFIILTGGNTVSSVLYNKNGHYQPTYNRDMTEYKLIEYAIHTQTPLIGICRGMQIINTYFGGKLVDVKSHLGKHSIVIGKHNKHYLVNSYHNQGVNASSLADCLNGVAWSVDKIIEVLQHKVYKQIIGLQWHPEREPVFTELDSIIFNNWIERKDFLWM